MAGSISTAMATTFKSELLSCGHNFNATVSPTFTVGSGSVSVTNVSSMTGVSVGMAFTCATSGIPANTVVARITASNALTLSALTTAAITGGTATIAGDLFFIALIKGGESGTYSAANTNYTDITGASDEVTNASGSAYTAGGQLLANNVSPVVSGTTAYTNWSANPSWTTASFSTAGCMIYNSSIRDGGTSGTNASGAGRCCSVHDFGGVQTVNAGTFSVILPVAAAGTAILRLS